MSKLLKSKKSRSPLPQRPSNAQIEKRAQRIWKMRVKAGKSGSPAEDWQRAIEELQVEQQSSLWETLWERFWRWTGISEKKGWDLMTGLSIPLLIFAGGSLFTFLNNQQQQKIADQNRKQDLKIADEKQKDEVLKNYFDTMRVLLLDKDKPLRKSKEGDESRSIARTMTLTALRQLESSSSTDRAINRAISSFFKGERKGLIIRFLYESNLIKSHLSKKKSITPIPIIDLSSANLSSANLVGADLSGADLSGADLSSAYLSSANLSGADLSGADLIGADLDANLIGADLSSANLGSANLVGADLSEANLRFAYLSGAYLSEANLSEANLSEANLSEANLSEAILNEAILLTVDLRSTRNLTQQQIAGLGSPLLCNVALPKELTGKPHSINPIHPNRDCDRIAEKLAERYPRNFPNLQKAREYVNQARQKKWD